MSSGSLQVGPMVLGNLAVILEEDLLFHTFPRSIDHPDPYLTQVRLFQRITLPLLEVITFEPGMEEKPTNQPFSLELLISGRLAWSQEFEPRFQPELADTIGIGHASISVDFFTPLAMVSGQSLQVRVSALPRHGVLTCRVYIGYNIKKASHAGVLVEEAEGGTLSYEDVPVQ